MKDKRIEKKSLLSINQLKFPIYIRILDCSQMKNVLKISHFLEFVGTDTNHLTQLNEHLKNIG